MISADQPSHKNDVHIAGFSDQILRYTHTYKLHGIAGIKLFRDSNILSIYFVLLTVNRFIAERSDAGQVTHVEKIDLKYNLKATAAKCSKTTKVVSTVNRPLPIKLPTPRYYDIDIAYSIYETSIFF